MVQIDSKTLSSQLKPLPRPNWLPEKVWPFQTYKLDVAGMSIAVTEAGSGPTLLLVHTGMWSFVWRDVMRQLSSEFRCICFDAPGNGQSGPAPARAVSLESAARVIEELVRALDLQDYVLVAHDLGGIAGVAAAARQPERVRGIVAVNTFGWRPSGFVFRGMLGLVGSAFMREINVQTGFLIKITSSAFGVGRHMDEASRDAFRAGVKNAGRRPFHYYMRSARNSDALYARVETALAGPFKNLPLLTIFGERNDPLGFQPRWKALFPKVRQVVIPQGNHFPMCDDPDTVAKSIRSWYVESVSPQEVHS